MKHPSSKALFAHWTAVRGERSAPLANAIDLMALAPVLADMVTIEIRSELNARPTLRIRLAGTRVEAIAQRGLSGTDLLDLWAKDDRPLIEDLVTTVACGNQPIVVGGHGAPEGCAPVDCEMLLVPVRDRGSVRIQVLGTFVLAQRPSWLGFAASAPFALASERMIDPDDTVQFDGHRPAKREIMSGFHRSRPFLTVVEGGRL